MNLKVGPAPLPSAAASLASTGVSAAKASLASIPDVSLADVQGCLARSSKARRVHEDILARVDSGERLGRNDVEAMLARAGADTTDVKTVLAYHAHHHTSAFDPEALTALAGLDWSDVAEAHVEELKRQNKEQVESHQTFLQADRTSFEQFRADEKKKLETQKLGRAQAERESLVKKSAFELEAGLLQETSGSGVTLRPEEATKLALHRTKFSRE